MQSPFWHTVGTLSVVAFVFAILLSLLARYWFAGNNSNRIKRAADILSSLGGARNSRHVVSELGRRKIT